MATRSSSVTIMKQSENNLHCKCKSSVDWSNTTALGQFAVFPVTAGMKIDPTEKFPGCHWSAVLGVCMFACISFHLLDQAADAG